MKVRISYENFVVKGVAILELLDKYPKDFEELNPLTVETEKGVALPQGGFAKPSRYYMLTEDQCYS